jgi:ribosomal protein S18 acetylase RimI-like enzyme
VKIFVAKTKLFFRFDAMEHLLDNPAWNALISGNNPLSYGNERVKYFDKAVSPFVGLNQNTREYFGLLHETLPHNGPVLFVATAETEIPEQWKVLRFIPGLQMVCDAGKVQDELQPEPVPLTEKHVPQMVALAKLTNPGPFAEKTIDFGHYRGVFEGGELVAMAGQRLHAFNYAEVSAVCTHPDHTGKGYARQLLQYQMNRIEAEGEIPYLHVRNDNERAIKVYESLGFVTRTEVYFYFMKKS